MLYPPADTAMDNSSAPASYQIFDRYPWLTVRSGFRG